MCFIRADIAAAVGGGVEGPCLAALVEIKKGRSAATVGVDCDGVEGRVVETNDEGVRQSRPTVVS